VNQLTSALQDDSVVEFFKEAGMWSQQQSLHLFISLLAFEYSIQNSSTPFLSHLATVAEPSSPMFQHIRTRCRAAMFLQGSAYYDLMSVRKRLVPWEDSLSFEMAVVDGKVWMSDYP